MAALTIYGNKNKTYKSTSPDPRKLYGWALVYNIEDKVYQVYSIDDPRITFDHFYGKFNFASPNICMGKKLTNNFLKIYYTNGWKLFKYQQNFVGYVLSPWDIYMYKKVWNP